MKKLDSLQRFIFEHAAIRGEIAHLDETYKTIIGQHAYPKAVQQLLGEALISCLLLVGSIKFEGEISLQFHGDERLPLLLVQCTHALQIRAYAQYQEDKEEVDYAEAFLQGKMVIMINQYNKTQVYQSSLPIQSPSMAENLMAYFANSEQISTYVALAVEEGKAAGMLLQLMPEQGSLERESFWEYAIQIGQTIRPEELLNLDNQTILHRLYHETEIRLFPAREVQFQCRCNEAKMKQVLNLLGEKELNDTLAERGKVEIHCDFCNKGYSFDSIDLALLFHQSKENS